MRYVFGDYSLDTQRYELRRAGELISLGPQVFDVLAYLVVQRDRVVSRDELFTRLWPEQFVTDDALGRCIRAARRALEDRPEAPRYIATSRGRGYRFIAPVQEQPHGPPEDGRLTMVPAQSSLPPLSAAGREGSPPPVSVPTGSGELPGLSEELRPPALAGEYKPVTVLCGGLADALALAMRLGPEAMHRHMQTVFALVHQVLHLYGGSLIEFGGEGFVALFGAPEAQEDHAQRAVLAALELQADVAASAPDLGQAPAEPLALCIGLHTGRVVVERLGGDPPRLYTAAGETTQVALRLRQLAAPGTTLLSAATQQLVHEHVRVESRVEVTVSEAQAPMLVYGVRGIARQRSGVVGHGAQVHSPFVGRARELALLQERLDAVVAGQGQVVALVGEPGMGKSRLLAECRRGLVEREVRYVEGHCLSYGGATPYLPLVDLVRQLCGMIPGEHHEAITAAVHRRLQEADVDPHEGVPLVLSLLDIPLETERLAQLSPPERKARTFALLQHLVFHEAQRHPCILAVENLHWSDATSAEWLTALIERLASAALLVLVTYRPGYQPPWLAQSYATQIALSPLRAEDSRTVVQAVLQTASVPETIVQEIVTQAAGNPFFLEELAWHVIEHGGGLHATLAVPETIEAVLAARIDRLPPAEKRLLQSAAVIGMAVPVPLLQAVTDLAAAELHTHLGHLQTAEFLSETWRRAAAAYTFKHALTHEVAYGSLLQEHRRALHGRAAHAIEALFAERLPEYYYALAHHYSHSGHTAKAVDYLQRAGHQAVERSAYAEAISHLTTALDLLSTLPETRERSQQELSVRMTLGIALRATKGQTAPEVERLYARARELCERVGEPSQLFRVLWGFCHVHALRGAYHTRRAMGEQLLSLAQRLQDSDFLLEAHHTLWTTLLSDGELAAARPHLEQGMKLYDPQRHRIHAALYSGHDSGVCCRMQAAHSLWLLGYPDQALASIQAALALAQQLAHPLSLSMALRWAAVLHYLRREAPLTQARAEAAITIATDQGFPEQVALVTPLRGWALTATGEGEEGIAQSRRGLAAYQATEVTRDRSDHLALLAETFGQVGQITKGLEALAEGLATVAKSRIRWWEAELWRLRGELLLQQTVAPPQEAEVCFQQALTVARREQAKSWELRAAMSLARLWQRRGKQAAAHELLAPVYSWFSEGFDTADLQEAKALLEELKG
jgi:predicted ATPase/DNA-binding winged helix-turn-helix (wHTH) protein/class 3 adenylate cyclase